MHINMKYYIVTISAIFIALGIGILVGFNLNYDQELSKQQAEVIDDLDKRFEALKETNEGLEIDLENLGSEYEEAIDVINKNIDKLIANQLIDENIGIISTNEKNDYTSDIEEIINNSQGKVAFNIVLNDLISDKSTIKLVAEKTQREMNSTDEVINYILETLNEENASSKLIELEEIGIIKINELSNDYSKYNSVILAGGNNHKDREIQFDKIDKVLIPELKQENKVIVGVQKRDTQISYTEKYKEEKISTIDNIDEGVGSLALITILKDGDIVGNFGRLESAQALLPIANK